MLQPCLFVVLPIQLWVLQPNPIPQKKLAVKHCFMIFSSRGLWPHSALCGLKTVNSIDLMGLKKRETSVTSLKIQNSSLVLALQ